MIFRIYNRQTTVDSEPKQSDASHDFDLRIEGSLRNDEMDMMLRTE